MTDGMRLDQEDDDGAFTVSEFCERYSVGRDFFYDQVRAGRLEAKKAGEKKTIILRSEARRWAKALPSIKL